VWRVVLESYLQVGVMMVRASKLVHLRVFTHVVELFMAEQFLQDGLQRSILISLE
jgi:hypothetical protein